LKPSRWASTAYLPAARPANVENHVPNKNVTERAIRHSALFARQPKPRAMIHLAGSCATTVV
jgi:hypothetical protein